MRSRWAPAALLVLLLGGVAAEAAVSSQPGIAAALVNVAHALHLSPFTAAPYTALVSIPYPAVERPDPNEPQGVQTVVRPGQTGLRRERGIQLYRRGAPYTRKAYAEVTLRPPTPALIALGTSTSFLHIHGQYYHYSRRLEMEATAYDASWLSNGRWTGQPTALGLPLDYGVVAVDPQVIPLGSRLYVQGYGLAIAADTGSAIHGDHIDLFFWDAPADTAAFGIRRVQVYVIDDPKLPPIQPRRPG
jgi:3D (Asp-Asp-Asp) domain-containing protein